MKWLCLSGFIEPLRSAFHIIWSYIPEGLNLFLFVDSIFEHLCFYENLFQFHTAWITKRLGATSYHGFIIEKMNENLNIKKKNSAWNSRIFLREHSLKTSANFHHFWPLPPYHRNSRKMLMKWIFDPYVLWPFDHRHMGTPLPPKTCWRLKWKVPYVNLCNLFWLLQMKNFKKKKSWDPKARQLFLSCLLIGCWATVRANEQAAQNNYYIESRALGFQDLYF